MKTMVFILALTSVLSTGLVLTTGISPDTSSEKIEWEYKFFEFDEKNEFHMLDLSKPSPMDWYAKRLNEIGNAGWEYCESADGGHVLFKRRKD